MCYLTLIIRKHLKKFLYGFPLWPWRKAWPRKNKNSTRLTFGSALCFSGKMLTFHHSILKFSFLYFLSSEKHFWEIRRKELEYALRLNIKSFLHLFSIIQFELIKIDFRLGDVSLLTESLRAIVQLHVQCCNQYKHLFFTN